MKPFKPEVHLPPASWICRCGVEEHTTGAHPDGWEWHGAALLCPDCQRLAAFAHGNESATILSPAPIRRTGPDLATSILLRSGAYLDLADPDCTRIEAVDIAAGLRQLRFAGQTREAYTIAQHSLLVLKLVEPLAAQIHDGKAADRLRWAALLHDAPEAFLHDITRPLKGQLPDYKRIEAMFETRFAAAFDIRWTQRIRQIVKMADLQALAIERRDLCPETADTRGWPVLAKIRPDTVAGIRITRVWTLGEAEDRFLEAMRQLRPTTLQKELAA